MRRIFTEYLAVLFLVFCSATGFADEGVKNQAKAQSGPQNTDYYFSAVIGKAVRGFQNILSGWTEIPIRVIEVTKASEDPQNPAAGVVWGLTGGIIQGTVKATVRTFSGLVDVITAPIEPQKDPFVPPDLKME